MRSRAPSRSLVSVLVGLSLLGPSAVMADDEPRHDERRTWTRSLGGRHTLAGTVTLNGCLAQARQIQLEAFALDVVAMDVVREVPAASAQEARSAARAGAFDGTVTRTRDPHVFAFVVPVRAQGVYRLAIGVDNASCGRVFWRGSVDGLAATGGPPVHIEGFAARTQIEVRADPSFRDPDLASPGWVGADAIDVTDAASATRTLRWRSSLPAVQSGELQVAAAPFPTRGPIDACAEPAEGLLLRQAVTGRPGRWAELAPIDFHALVTPRRAAATADDDAVLNPAESSVASIARRVRAGTPLYVRIIPIVDGRRRCEARRDGVPGWVMLAQISPQGPVVPPVAPAPSILQADFQSYTPPFTGDVLKGRPTYGERGFKVLRDHVLPPVFCTGWAGMYYLASDPIGCEIVAAQWFNPGATVKKGTRFILGPPPSSGGGGGGLLSFFTDTLPSLATGLVDAIGMAVDYLSGLVEDVKGALADVVMSVLTSLPLVNDACVGLGSTGLTDCETLVKGAMETGMVAMGLPPSLPNWEELKDQGVDYLAAQIATDVAGGPLAQTLTQAAITEIAQKTLDTMTAKKVGASGAYGWVQPYLFYDPAVWVTSVSWTGTGTLPSELILRRYSTSLFAGGDVPLPTTTLPQVPALNIPMVLPAQLGGIPAPLCRRNRFGQVSCQPNIVSTLPRCQGEVAQWTSGGGQTTSEWVWMDVDCAYVDYVAIYYRDRWVTQRYDAAGCVNLSASSLQDVNGLLLPAPQPPFFTLGRVESDTPQFWVGPVWLSPGCP